jgi:hypothetical protein
MKKIISISILIFFCVSLCAGLPRDEYVVIDNYKNIHIELGVKLSKMIKAYPRLSFIQERKYSNITLKEYRYDGISFFISAFSESDNDANIRMIEILSNVYSTKRGITIGSHKSEVISKYGQPDDIYNGIYYYENHEYEVMELSFKFDKMILWILLSYQQEHDA